MDYCVEGETAMVARSNILLMLNLTRKNVRFERKVVYIPKEKDLNPPIGYAKNRIDNL